jgi:CheY-like chemotaxis protein
MPERAFILVADDSEGDIIILRKAFEKAYVPNPLFGVKSGAEAISYLKGEGRYSNRNEFPLPDLMLLDLKMPGEDGFDVLTWIRQQPGLKSMRVVVLSASDHIRDVNKAYQLGANSFLVKPSDFENFVELARSISTNWLRHGRAPETSRDTQAHHGQDRRPADTREG